MVRFGRITLLLVLGCQGAIAWAGPLPDAREQPLPTPGEPAAPPPSTIPGTLSGRSEFNRQSRQYGLWAGVGARTADMMMVDIGFEAAYFWSPNELISVHVSRLVVNESDFHSLRVSADGYEYTTSHMDLDGSAVSFNWKSFLSNSFYIKAGLEQFNLKGEYYTSRDSRRIHLGNLSRQNALFAIGNQWQWRGFTMGCDWAGFTYPIAYSFVSYNDEIESTMTNKFVNAGNKTLANLLYFYLGGTF